MSGAPNLSNAVINLAALRERSRQELISVLDSVRGRKALVLDQGIAGPLGLIAEASLLKEHGVEKMYHLLPGRLDTECKSVVYLCRPKLKYMKYISEHIHTHESEGGRSGVKKDYYLFFVPRRTNICERVLEEEGVFGDITFRYFDLDLIAFDDDVLSLELDTSYRECMLDGDKTSLFYAARSIMKLQSLYGLIPNIKGKGTCARLVADMIMRMRRELGPDEEPTMAPEIDTIILIDRDVDMITPVCTQLTYEGLVDEVYGVQNSYIEVDAEVVGALGGKDAPKPVPGKKVKYALNCSDKLYSEIRNLNFTVIGSLLNRKAKEIDEYYKSRHGMSVSALRDFTKKLATTQQEHASLNIHTNISEKIMRITSDPAFHRRIEAEQCLLAGTNPESSVDYIEECINKKDPLVKILRLLILLNATSGGLKAKQLEFFKREIIQTYGYEFIFTLNNMEKLGLVHSQQSKGPTFAALRKALRLVVEDIDENNPNDIAYVYSGYAPLSVRLVQQACRPGGWRQGGMEEMLRALPGPSFEETQVMPAGVSYTPVSQLSGAESSVDHHPVTLVFYLGGVTFTEIAALRFLSQHGSNDGSPSRDFIIATTKLINGDTVIDTLVDKVVPRSESGPAGPAGGALQGK